MTFEYWWKHHANLKEEFKAVAHIAWHSALEFQAINNGQFNEYYRVQIERLNCKEYDDLQ